VQYKNVSNSSISGVIKDVDAKTGMVTGYFAIFGNVDSDGDMIMPGAFKRSLENNYHRQKHLNQHISTQVLSGTKKGNLVLKEDKIGLYFESRIGQYSYAKDTILGYERGDIDEHSIGYEVKKQQKASSYNELLELKLWEGSTVTWGANELALMSGAKSLFRKLTNDPVAYLKDVFIDLKNGKVDDEDIEDVILYTYKQLFGTNIIDLSTSSTQPAAKITAPDPQTGVKSDDLSEDEATLIYLKLKSITSKHQVKNETQLQRMALS
jgi:HK97 family phage prohead protease